MDDKKKILLGEKDVIGRDNEDLYINVNLNSTFSEIRDDKVENVFDVADQFKKERNASRDFRIYGIVDATIVDCDNLTISVYHSAFSGTGINSGTTQLSGFVKSITTTPLVYDGINAYGMKRGKYIVELTGYTHDSVYFKIPSNNFDYKDQIYGQQLVFRDADGNFVDYGTQTIEINEDGNVATIDNDFYFLYNKHWIKKDLLIVEEKPAKVFLSAISQSVTIPESNVANTAFAIALDKPSPFGLEQVDLVNIASTLSAFGSEINIYDVNTNYPLPNTFSFSAGEQYKFLYFNSALDTLQEFTESIILGLDNFQIVETASPLTHIINVTDATPKNYVTLNFQNIYQNRNYFPGITKRIGFSNYSYPMPAVLRNGLYYEGTPMEFYPVDNFTLKITNTGATTVLPINPALGINTEQVFTSGQQLSFPINIGYQNSELHTIKFYFSRLNAHNTITVPWYNSYSSGLTINGIPIIDYYQNYKFDYNTFKGCLQGQPVLTSSNFNLRIDGWNKYGFEIPFTVVEDLSALTLTIIAKNPGTRLDVYSYGGVPDIFNASNPFLVTLGITAETIQNFVLSAQNPLQIFLRANFAANSQAKYQFEISKNGYDTMKFEMTPANATITGTPYYLVAGYHDILRNYDTSLGNPVIYNHSGVTSDWYSTVSTGNYTSGEAYVNGILLLANKYFAPTQNNPLYVTGGQSLNQSHFGNVVGDFKADFKSAPIATIPEVTNYYSTVTQAQEGYLMVTAQVPPSTYIQQRSFDFRTGGTGFYTTFYSPLTSDAYTWWNYFSTYASGATTLNTAIPLKNYLQLGYSSYGITPQGLTGVNPVSVSEANRIMKLASNLFTGTNRLIKLTSGTPGNPFEITNIKDQRNSAGQIYQKSIDYIETIPNTIANTTINKANNYLGGYSFVHP
jgi:hypothetical protein